MSHGPLTVQCSATLAQDSELAAVEDRVDKVDMLDLDDEPGESARKRRRRLRAGPRPREDMPSSVVISVKMYDGTTWEPRVLLDNGVAFLFLEFTTANMNQLYREVQHELKALASSPTEEASASSPTQEPEDQVETPVKILCPMKGVTWDKRRKCWIARYTDRKGKTHATTVRPKGAADLDRELAMDAAVKLVEENGVKD